MVSVIDNVIYDVAEKYVCFIKEAFNSFDEMLKTYEEQGDDFYSETIRSAKDVIEDKYYGKADVDDDDECIYEVADRSFQEYGYWYEYGEIEDEITFDDFVQIVANTIREELEK